MKKRYFVARAIKGQEYRFVLSSARIVSDKYRTAILHVLNEHKFDLKPGETWHLYNNADDYDIYARYAVRGGHLNEEYL